MSKKEIDCCPEPSLKTVKTFVSTDELLIRIRRCAKCGAHWFCHVRAFEVSGCDHYNRFKWYVRLSEDEAAVLIQSDDPPATERFHDRPGFLRDDDGLNRIQGVPDYI